MRSLSRTASIGVGILVVSLVPTVPTSAGSSTPGNVSAVPADPVYLNPHMAVGRRVADLLGRMTLEEKVAQLTALWVQKPQVGPQGDFSTDRGDFSPDAWPRAGET